jgi:L-2,4-diaminobutyrate decarboxylase
VFERDFVTGEPESQAALGDLVGAVLEILKNRPDRPYSGRSPQELSELLACDLAPEFGTPADEVLDRLSSIVANSIDVSHPKAIAHLHCSTLIPAVAADLLAAAINPSMDSFDQAPAATMIELQVLRCLCVKAGLPAASGGTFTPGATQSNFFGLLLAREVALERFGIRGWRDGLGSAGRSLRILCSEAAHFTVEKSAAQLGLGTEAVVRIPCDKQFRMFVPALQETIDRHARDGLHVMAIVATAGTTDFGSIDPLQEIGVLARSAGAWFHIDAAYGGAFVVSVRLRN